MQTSPRRDAGDASGIVSAAEVSGQDEYDALFRRARIHHKQQVLALLQSELYWALFAVWPALQHKLARLAGLCACG